MTAADFFEKRLLHFDHFQKAADELQLVFDRNNPNGFVESVYAIDSSWFSKNGFETDIDEFKLKQLRVIAIDNMNTRLHYDGSFFGNHDSFDPIDWGLYATIECTGINRELPYFYYDLVGESFLLFNQQQYQLSYFLAYTAFESFITSHLTIVKDERKLKEKVTAVFREKFPNIEKHQVYTSVMVFYDSFTTNRNNIAHGNGNVVISKEDAERALMFIQMMLTSYAFSITTFDEL